MQPRAAYLRESRPPYVADTFASARGPNCAPTSVTRSPPRVESRGAATARTTGGAYEPLRSGGSEASATSAAEEEDAADAADGATPTVTRQ